MTFLRWLLVIPGAIIALMAGSLGGGLIFSLFGLLGQGVADTGSAFAGSLAFVFASCLLAPSRKRLVGLIATLLISVLALGTVVLSNFTTIEEFVRLSTRERVVTPVAQLLGALYALFIGLPLLSAGTLLDDLWREIRALGLLVILLGAVLMIVGGGFALAGFGWLGLATGACAVLLGILTWVSPFIHLSMRMNSMKKNLNDILDADSL